MEGKKKGWLYRFLNPTGWVTLLVYATGIIFYPLTLYAVVHKQLNNTFERVLCVAVSLLFCYSVTITIMAFRRVKRKVLVFADKYAFTRELHENSEFRSFVFAVVTLVGNVGYTLFLCFIAFESRLIWYGALAVYYILLTTVRGGVLFEDQKNELLYARNPIRLLKARLNNYFYCGAMLVGMTLALALAVIEMIINGGRFDVPQISVYVFAAVSAYRIGLAIYNHIRAKRYDDLMVRSVRYINFATALVAVLSLEAALLDSFATINVSWIIGISGGLVCATILVLGVRMMRDASAEREKIQEEQWVRQTVRRRLRGYNRADYWEEYGETESPEKQSEELDEETDTVFKMDNEVED